MNESELYPKAGDEPRKVVRLDLYAMSRSITVVVFNLLEFTARRVNITREREALPMLSNHALLAKLIKFPMTMYRLANEKMLVTQCFQIVTDPHTMKYIRFQDELQN